MHVNAPPLGLHVYTFNSKLIVLWTLIPHHYGPWFTIYTGDMTWTVLHGKRKCRQNQPQQVINHNTHSKKWGLTKMKSIIWVTQAGGLVMHMPQVSIAIIKPLIHPDLFNICSNLLINILILRMKINVNRSFSRNWLTMNYKGVVFDTLKIGKNRPRCVYNAWTYTTGMLVPSRMRKEYLCVSLGLHLAKSFLLLYTVVRRTWAFFPTSFLQLILFINWWKTMHIMVLYIFNTLMSKSSIIQYHKFMKTTNTMFM